MIDRKELNRKLPKGYRKVIANELGVSQQSISNYLASRNYSERIERAILKKLAELKKEKDLLLKRI